MNNNSWFKKEMPLQTVIGFGGGATGFGVHSSSASKVYVDDIFSTFLWTGDGISGRSISNGIKLSDNNAGNSVYLDGSSDWLSIPSSSDFAFGTGDFTWEAWFYLNDDGSYLINFGDNGNLDYYTYGGITRRLRYYNSTASHHEDSSTVLSLNTWYHIAVSRSSGTTKVFLNGTEKLSFTDNHNYGAQTLYLGATSVGGSLLTGNISNLRIVKGQALYTSNFTPSTEALTTTSQGATASNVKLLCCNKTTVTGSTVTPGTITKHGDPLSQGFGPFTGSDGKGGLAWMKSRSTGNVNVLFDTERGANQRLRSDSDLAQNTADLLQPSFTNSGFTVGSGNEVNGSNNEYASWTFREQKGFFDIVTYTGTGNTINGDGHLDLNHSLNCIPGCMMVKRTDSNASYADWYVYHRGLGATSKAVFLNTTDAAASHSSYWNGTAPTSSQFTVGEFLNVNGATYVAYLFAGGKSSNNNAVNFDGTDDRLTFADSSDFNFGTGDFTVEGWFAKPHAASTGFFQISDTTGGLKASTSDSLALRYNASGSGKIQLIYNDTSVQANYSYTPDKFTHFAVCRLGTVGSSLTKVFIDGVELISQSDTKDYNFGNLCIGGYYVDTSLMDGKIANFRVVKGQALYTSDFTPATEVYTTSSRDAESDKVKLICCNGSTTTAATVTPGTITAVGDPTVSTGESIFDDPDSFVFGEGGDQNVIKTGSYIGNSTANHQIYLGWEPQWWLVKNITDSGSNWQLLDSMRGWVDDGNDQYFAPNNTSQEYGYNFGNPTPTGFNLSSASSNWQNDSGKTYVYIAIRRPDGYVEKPSEVGTEVFAMDTGASSVNIPNFDSGFPVDFAFLIKPATTSYRYTATRLTGTWTAYANAGTNTTWSGFNWDSNVGYEDGNLDSTWQSWMWKRHIGFDVVPYEGTNRNNLKIPHSLNAVPEMMIIKNRDANENWAVYHKGLNGGTDPQDYVIRLNSTNGEFDHNEWWNDTAPTSTHFTLGFQGETNGFETSMVAMLFSSVEGVSKVGHYTGNGSATGPTVTLGFAPRLIIIKGTTGGTNWFLYDTLRGLGSGNDQRLDLNDTGNQSSSDDLDTSATGFQVISTWDQLNGSGQDYIYYAHA